MTHLPWLLEQRADTGCVGDGLLCGHVLMASCPPQPFRDLTPDVPFSHRYGDARMAHANANAGANANSGDENANGGGSYPGGHRTWELGKGDLATLLALSRRLNLDGEITPVMAWGMVLAHPRLPELGAGDFARLAEELCGKIRCYG